MSKSLKSLLIATGLITFLIGLHFTWLDVQRASICDTTYINEGYATVELPPALAAAFPRYKLVRYVDRSPHLQKGTIDPIYI